MKELIDRTDYLKCAEEMTDLEKRYLKEYATWLPNQIIDCHTHCGLASHVNYIEERDFNHRLSTFPSFNIEESKYWNNKFYLNKHVRVLRFPMVFRGIDHKAANSYLLQNSPKDDRIAIFGLHNDIKYTIKQLNHPRVSALKMYPFYPEPKASTIYEYFPHKVLEVVQNKHIPIILHLPTKLSGCFKQVLDLINDFPQLNVCIAHIGLTETVTDDFVKALDVLSNYDSVSFDTSLIKSSEVLKCTIQIIGDARIMFGSDAPIHLVRTMTYHNPKLGLRLATTHPYHWVNKKEYTKYSHLTMDLPYDHLQSLNAIRAGISAFPFAKQEVIKKRIFHDNAKLFYNFS